MDGAGRKDIGSVQLGTRIRELRMRSEGRLVDLAGTAGISVSFLSDVERGRHLPSLEVLDAIAVALDTSVCALLSGLYPWDSNTIPTRVEPLRDGRTRLSRD
ncbi:MAG: helix-turn-helix transcriptional regulator [Nocardioides sp.]|nr:helix-turn-helix transcriptional regulator [Nocardioides sp.]